MCSNTGIGAIPLSKGDSTDPYEQALLWMQAQLGIVVTAEERMHLVAISDHVVTDCIGASKSKRSPLVAAWCFGSAIPAEMRRLIAWRHSISLQLRRCRHSLCPCCVAPC